MASTDKETDSRDNCFISFIKGCLKIAQSVTVEPLVGCFIIPTVLCAPAIRALEYEKACRVDGRYSDIICDTIMSGTSHNYIEQNKNIQKIISNMYSWQYPLQNVVPILLILFLGSYSDRYNIRKPFLVIPFIGQIIGISGTILCVIFMKLWPVTVQGLMQIIVPSFFGGQPMILMGAAAYISDISSVEMRTFRLGIIHVIKALCNTVLNSVGGLLYEYLGYIGVFGIGSVLYTIGLCYGTFCIKEVTTRKCDVKCKFNESDDEMKRGGIFDISYAAETLSLLFKKRENVKRSMLIYALTIMFMATIVSAGEKNVLWLYTQHVFNWTSVYFSYHKTVRTGASLIGTILLIPLFIKVFKFKDTTIICISHACKICTNLVYVLYINVTGLFVAAFTNVCLNLAEVALRASVTKCVSSDNLAKALSLLALCETLALMVATPIYNQGVYNQTFDIFPQAFFIVGIALIFLCIIITICVHFAKIANPQEVTEPEVPKKEPEKVESAQEKF